MGTESRYRMRRRSRLPKFGSSGNPFTARSESVPASPEIPAVERSETAAREPSPQEIAAANLKDTRRLPVVDSKAKAAGQFRAPAKQAARRPKAWARKLNPFSWWSKRESATRPAGFQKRARARPVRTIPGQRESGAQRPERGRGGSRARQKPGCGGARLGGAKRGDAGATRAANLSRRGADAQCQISSTSRSWWRRCWTR